MVVLLVHLHLQEVAAFPYLDDILVRSRSLEPGQHHLSLTMGCLSQDGFLVNLQKSYLHPSHSIKHLGDVIDTRLHMVFLSPERQLRIVGQQSSSYTPIRLVDIDTPAWNADILSGNCTVVSVQVQGSSASHATFSGSNRKQSEQTGVPGHSLSQGPTLEAFSFNLAQVSLLSFERSFAGSLIDHLYIHRALLCHRVPEQFI